MGWPNVYLCIVYLVIATHLIAKEGMYAGFAGAKTGVLEWMIHPSQETAMNPKNNQTAVWLLES